MPSPSKRSLVLAALIGSTVMPVFSETVFQLKNGDRVTGWVLSEDTNQVVIATAWVREVTLPLSQIVKREEIPAKANEASTNAPTASTNAMAITSSLPSVMATNAAAAIAMPGTILNTNAPATVTTNLSTGKLGTNAPTGLGTNAVAGVSKVAAKPPKRWDFELQIGASVQYNQKSYQNFNGLAKANYKGDLLRDTLDYHAAYGRTEGVPKANPNNMEGNNRIEHDLDKARRAFVFDAFGIGYDMVRDIDLTYDDSLGVGYKFIQKPKFTFSGDFGGNYQKQYFSADFQQNQVQVRRTANTAEYFSLRFGEAITWAINNRVTFDEKSEFYPHMSELGAYRVRAEGNVNIKLNDPGTIYMVFSGIDIYDTKPPQGITRNDLQLSARVGLKF